MGTKRPKPELAEKERTEDLSVPPGFASLTSFLLKRAEEANAEPAVAADASINRRPWVLPHESGTGHRDQDSDSAKRDAVVVQAGGDSGNAITCILEETPVFRPTEEVLCSDNLDSRTFGSGFSSTFNSGWNLNDLPRHSGSLLSFESFSTCSILAPKLRVGMCFATSLWKCEEHCLYSVCYTHIGAPIIWYCIPGRYRAKFEAIAKKYSMELLSEQHKLNVFSHLSPSTLKSQGIPVYRCAQSQGELVVIFPGAYKSGFGCGFNCVESVNVAPLDWLSHGQNVVELYREKRRKTMISHDKLLLGGAREAVRAQWELLLLKKETADNLRWKHACGKDGILVKALKSRVKWESLRREYLCNSSQSKKMDQNFDASTKRECGICHFDLHLSAVSCKCSRDKYSCLDHATLICSCAWTNKVFLFRYEVSELNLLIEALEGKLSAVYKWAKVLGLAFKTSTEDLPASSVLVSKSTSDAEPTDSGQKVSTSASITSRAHIKAELKEHLIKKISSDGLRGEVNNDSGKAESSSHSHRHIMGVLSESASVSVSSDSEVEITNFIFHSGVKAAESNNDMASTKQSIVDSPTSTVKKATFGKPAPGKSMAQDAKSCSPLVVIVLSDDDND
ncbi:hypothetical protein BT93_I0066 [Corymbia citriodora subsp. variegata]|nr:hypothetical protein BT93_I0066 [Corymbia citriodora subsp. variegata]KAF8011809.1 hypothetical protein BT93_I0066 [Corymbia citriodora subsp. variegata]